MTNDLWLGSAGGLASSLLMYALLFPIARGGPLPPDAIVARLGGGDVRAAPARVGGFLLQLAFGLFWGFLMGYWNHTYYPLAGSYILQGLVWGLAAFLFSFFVFGALGLLGKPFDRTQWVGFLLNHLVFGAALGIAFLLWAPGAPSP